MPRSFLGRVWRTLREGSCFLLGRREVFRIEGRSMWPTLQPGDLVFIDPKLRGEVGCIVVARLRDGRKVCKRIASRSDTSVALGSDNPAEATDSRHFGSLDATDVVGEVTLTRPWR